MPPIGGALGVYESENQRGSKNTCSITEGNDLHTNWGQIGHPNDCVRELCVVSSELAQRSTQAVVS